MKMFMKRFLFGFITSILLVYMGAITASAQRTAPGKVFIGLDQYASGYSIPSGGAGIEAVSIGVSPTWASYAAAQDAAGTYGRTFNVYFGGGAFIGINHYEVFRKLPTEISPDFRKAEFVYGVDPELEFEVFPFRKVALVLGIQSPLTFSSSLSTDFWHLSASLGIRINL